MTTYWQTLDNGVCALDVLQDCLIVPADFRRKITSGPKAPTVKDLGNVERTFAFDETNHFVHAKASFSVNL